MQLNSETIKKFDTYYSLYSEYKTTDWQASLQLTDQESHIKSLMNTSIKNPFKKKKRQKLTKLEV